METRKVQITGGSTYIVSLPKNWVKEVGMKPTDTIGFIPQHDGTMLLTPGLIKGSEERKKVFKVDVKKVDDGLLLRSLIGAYMMGYDRIVVQAKPRMPPEVRDIVRNFTVMTIGPEIIDEGLDQVVTKDLLDPTDLPFESSIRRMHRIVDSMHHNALLALKEMNVHLANDVISRDAEVDRLNWLVARQYNMLIRDIKLAQKMGTTRERSINFILIARIIERIGDHATKIAENVVKLEDSKISKKKKEQVISMGEASLDLLETSMKGLFKKKLAICDEVITGSIKYVKGLDDLESTVLAKESGPVALSLGHIFESIRRTAFYSRDISECAINYLVDSDQD